MTTTSTNLCHFKSTSAVYKFAVEMILGELRDDLAVMTGSEADRYSDEEVAEIEDQISDLAVACAALRSDAAAKD